MNIIEQFNPGPHHKLVIDHITENRFSIIMNSDETGITRSYAMFLLDYILKNKDKRIVISSGIEQTLMEVKSILIELFEKIESQVEIKLELKNNKALMFSNGCRLQSYLAHKNTSIASKKVDCFILMDMAHVRTSEVEGLYEAMVPQLLSDPKARMIINSSPKGTNLFYDIFSKAELSNDHEEKNSFSPLRLYYWMVPGRDGDWVKDKIREFGEDHFNQRFNLMFNCRNSGEKRLKMYGKEVSYKSEGYWAYPELHQLPKDVIGFEVTFKYNKDA
jgi:hypothetical protein